MEGKVQAFYDLYQHKFQRNPSGCLNEFSDQHARTKMGISFSLAENQKFKDDQGNSVEKTTWVNCTLWKDGSSSTAILPYLTRGTKVYLEGVPDVKVYKDKNGVSQAELRLNVPSIELLHVAKDGVPVPEQTEEAPF